MAGVFVCVCEWPRCARARVEKGGMELRVQQQHGGWDVEPSYASYEASLPGIVTRSYEIVRGELAWEGEAGRVYRRWTLARGQARGGARFSTLTRDAVCCCVAVDGRRERVWSALCCWTGLGSGHQDMVDPCYTASRHPCVPSSKINGFKAATNLIPCLILTTRNINIHTVPTNEVRTSGGYPLACRLLGTTHSLEIT